MDCWLLNIIKTEDKKVFKVNWPFSRTTTQTIAKPTSNQTTSHHVQRKHYCCLHRCFSCTISVSAKSHAAAVKHYNTVLRAKQVTSGSKVVLESAYGFRFRIDASNSSSLRLSFRLGLPPNVSREAIAHALSGSASRPRKSRSGTTVTDRFGVTWTLSWLLYLFNNYSWQFSSKHILDLLAVS